MLLLFCCVVFTFHISSTGSVSEAWNCICFFVPLSGLNWVVGGWGGISFLGRADLCGSFYYKEADWVLGDSGGGLDGWWFFYGLIRVFFLFCCCC